MSYLKDTASLFSLVNKFISLFDSFCYWFFYKDVFACFKTIQGNAIMSCRGCYNTKGINFIENLFVVIACFTTVLFCKVISLFFNDINSSKFYVFKFRINPCMVLTEISDPNNPYLNSNKFSSCLFQRALLTLLTSSSF